MLRSVVIQFSPMEEMVIPPTNGHLVHAWFLDLVRTQDRALSERLHKEDREKPFTVSPINGKIERRDGQWWLLPDQRYWVRFTGLEKTISDILVDLPVKPAGPGLFQTVPCEVVKIYRSPEEHEWAGEISYDALIGAATYQAGSPTSPVRFHFASPTTFRTQDGDLPVPLPALVFGSLARKWDAYSTDPIGPELAARLTETVLLSRYELRTSMQDFGRYRLVGFTGDCEYQVRRGVEPSVGQAVRVLAAFAFYAGVGYHTTMGLGQARLQSVESGTR